MRHDVRHQYEILGAYKIHPGFFTLAANFSILDCVNVTSTYKPCGYSMGHTFDEDATSRDGLVRFAGASRVCLSRFG